METSIEVRYAGVVVGRGAVLRDLGPEGTFVGIAEPMPVGTRVTLKIGAESLREARVDEVVESADPNAVGMRVRFDGAAHAAAVPATAAEVPPSRLVVAPVASSGPVAAAVPQAEAAPPQAVAAAALAAAPVSESDDVSGALPAPLSLAGLTADGSHGGGGGKRRRKRR